MLCLAQGPPLLTPGFKGPWPGGGEGVTLGPLPGFY